MTFVIVLFVFSLWFFLGGDTNFILILCKSRGKKGWAETALLSRILSSSNNLTLLCQPERGCAGLGLGALRVQRFHVQPLQGVHWRHDPTW